MLEKRCWKGAGRPTLNMSCWVVMLNELMLRPRMSTLKDGNRC